MLGEIDERLIRTVHGTELDSVVEFRSRWETYLHCTVDPIVVDLVEAHRHLELFGVVLSLLSTRFVPLSSGR